MVDSAFINILKTFSKAEIRGFSRFVNSPYFNTSANTALLYEEIKKFYPSFGGKDFTREKLFAVIYPGKKNSKDLMNRLLSNLIKLAEKFISLESGRYEKQNLLYGLRQKKLYGHFLSAKKKYEKNSKLNLFEDEDVMQHLLLDDEYGNYFLDTDKYINWDLHTDLSMEYHLIHFLYKVSQVFRQKTFYSTQKDRNRNAAFHLEECMDLKKLYSTVKSSEIKNKELICHYLTLVIMNSTKDKQLYEEIKTYIFSNKQINSTRSIYIGYIYMLDLLSDVLKNTTGEERRYYLKEKNLVYKKIESVYFATGKVKMLFVFFRNFILSGINTGDLKWSEYVFNKYIRDVREKGNESVGKYYESLILFHKGKFEDALQKLSLLKSEKFQMDKNLYFYDIRILRLMLYYELNYLQEALSNADAFVHMLNKSSKMPVAHKASASYFATGYKKILACRMDNNTSSLPAAIKKISAERSYYGKTWLLNKAAEMMKK